MGTGLPEAQGLYDPGNEHDACGLAAVVRKLMAKKPADRYQTPADVAAVLTAGLRTGDWPAATPAVAAVTARPAVALPARAAGDRARSRARR